MLQSLHIENVAVIRRADIDFSEGLCVLTGETGAGKSLLIDSINALMGGRVNRELIRTGEDKAMISALFTGLDSRTMQALGDMGLDLPPYDDALMLQRVFTRDGRSTARINGRAVTQSLLRDAGALLINIHGQSDNQKLMQKSTHLSLLDDYAQDGETLSAYREVFFRWKEADEKLKSLRQDEAERLRTREMLEFQIKDIESAKLKIGEEEKLTERRDRLLYQEKISKQVHIAARALKDSEKSTVLSLLDRAETALTAIAGLVPEADSLVARLQQVRYEAEDIADQVSTLCDDDVEDPTAALDKLEARLDTINRLSRKYGVGIEAILAFRDASATRLAELDSADDRIADYEKECAACTDTLRTLSMRLSEQRRAAAHELAVQVAQSLAFLDMPKVRFEVSVKPLGRFCADGSDDVEFLIATNAGEPVQSMIRIASGGELSRIMLAVRSVLNEKYGVGTAIYDEVDTGISGRTARKVGIKLCAIAAGTQVICVTHSAQIASLADAHYVIEKSETEGRAETQVRLLTETEQVDEVARILGGLTLTDSQRAAAQELISEKTSIRESNGQSEGSSEKKKV